MDSYLRPKAKPPEPETNVSYDDLEKIERVVWAEANTEGIEGRNAVRGVIFNRLASGRFGDTVDDVLISGQFEPIDTYGSISEIPVPEDQLSRGMEEIVDYIQLGDDASQGSTFFQNEKKTKTRGSQYEGQEPVQIGNHTFYKGYGNQEPVTDLYGSHNIKVVQHLVQEEPMQSAAVSFAFGGLAASRKGITTQEGLDMANNRFQLDQKKADLDKDGKLSDYEEARGEAIQKANADDPENDEKMKMYHGGMPCDCGGDCDGSCGGMMSDPVSGNPIPVGSSAENVRDDIEAMISEGEYVLPANVVKWHGLKHIMDMQAEAEMGLMGMFDMGLIQYAGEEEAEEPEEVTEAEDDIPEEDVDIEVAAVEVDDMLDEDEEVEEVYPKTSKLPGMMNTPKMVFMS